MAGLLALPGLVPSSLAQRRADAKRIIRGQVLDENGKAVATAIVHLKNVTSKEGWSVVTDKEGRYQFNDVDMKTDHKLHAEWRKQKSRARSVSQFDTRPLVVINLRLEPQTKSKDKKEEKDKAKDEKEKKD